MKSYEANAIEDLNQDLINILEGIIERMDRTNKILEDISHRISFISGDR